MAFTFDPIFATDPNNSQNVAANAAIVLFDPADAGKAPITITDVTGAALPNPITVNKNGFGPAFVADLDRIGWFGGGFTGYFTSYEGLKNAAVASASSAQIAAGNAASAAAADIAARIEAGEFKGEPGVDGSNVLPTDTAIAAAINGTGATKTALGVYATNVSVTEAVKPVKAEALAATRGKTFKRPKETVIANFKAGHGWVTAGSWTASNLNDTTDGSWTDRCLSGTTNGASGGAVFDKITGITPFDPTSKVLCISLKISDVDKLQDISVYLSSSGDLNVGNATYSLFGGAGSNANIGNNEWCDFYVPLANPTATVGAGQGTAVNTIRLRVSDNATGTVTAKFGGISHAPKQTTYPNGVVALTFDDGLAGAYTIARPKMSEYRFRGSVHPVVDAIGTAGILTLTQLKALDALGWEIASHAAAVSTTRLDTLTADQRETEHKAVKSWLVANGFKSDGLAYPGGIWTGGARESAQRYFSYGRTVRHGQQVLPPADPMRLHSNILSPTQNLAWAKLRVDQAFNAGTLVTFTIHDLSSSGGAYSWTVADFEALVDYIAGKGMPVVPLGEVLASFTG